MAHSFSKKKRKSFSMLAQNFGACSYKQYKSIQISINIIRGKLQFPNLQHFALYIYVGTYTYIRHGMRKMRTLILNIMQVVYRCWDLAIRFTTWRYAISREVQQLVAMFSLWICLACFRFWNMEWWWNRQTVSFVFACARIQRGRGSQSNATFPL